VLEACRSVLEKDGHTSVTACDRGRLPTWVVRMRSVLCLIDTCYWTYGPPRASV
jgi:hypothetical protein